MAVIDARGVRKAYGRNIALDGVDLRIDEGRIVGLIGPNGAGKTTALSAIVGLTPCEGHLRVLGRDPWTERDALASEVSFITDVAVLPRWIRVGQAVDFVAATHPRFDRSKAEAFLARTNIKLTSRVRELSKGMVTQLHLAIVMAIDARLLILDEPTLGLDLLVRKQFYDTLLTYLEQGRTVVVATHQVDDVEHILTDVVYIDRGRIVLSRSMEEVQTRYREVFIHPDKLVAARALHPIAERQGVGHAIAIFEGADPQALAQLGEVRTPTIADLFVAVMSDRVGQSQEAL